MPDRKSSPNWYYVNEMCSGSQAQSLMRNSGLLLAFLHVLAVAGLAEAPLSDWQNLSRIVQGTVVGVERSPVDEVIGKFVRFSDNDLTLDVKGKEITIGKPAVTLVVVKRSDGHAALAGAAAGGAAGAVLAGAARDKEQRAGNAAGGGAAAGAAIGAVIGGGLKVETVIYNGYTLERLHRKRSPKSQPAGTSGSKR